MKSLFLVLALFSAAAQASIEPTALPEKALVVAYDSQTAQAICEFSPKVKSEITADLPDCPKEISDSFHRDVKVAGAFANCASGFVLGAGIATGVGVQFGETAGLTAAGMEAAGGSAIYAFGSAKGGGAKLFGGCLMAGSVGYLMYKVWMN